MDQFVKRIRQTGSLLDKATRSRARPVRSTENIATVAQSVLEQSSTSTRHRFQNLNISRTSLRRILNKDLGMKPYKVQLVQELKPHDHPLRFRFAYYFRYSALNGLNNAWLKMSIFIEKSSFLTKLIFTSVNKQNCRIWGSENPHVVMKKSMHPQRETIWCGFWSGGIIGPFFFEKEQGAAIIVNGERYRAMLNEFLLLKFEEEDTDDIWFQQDGASCHTANATIDLLRTVFENRIISRNVNCRLAAIWLRWTIFYREPSRMSYA